MRNRLLSWLTASAIVLTVAACIVVSVPARPHAQRMSLAPPAVYYAPDAGVYRVTDTRRGKQPKAAQYPQTKVAMLRDPNNPGRVAVVGSSFDQPTVEGVDYTGAFPDFQIAGSATVELEHDGPLSHLQASPSDQEDPNPFTFIRATSLDDEELFVLAESIDWDDGYPVIDADAVPQGMEVSAAAPMMLPVPQAHVVTVETATGDELTISTLQAPAVLVELYGAYYGITPSQDAAPLTRRGHSGYRLFINTAHDHVVDVWAENGVIIAVSAKTGELIDAAVPSLSEHPESDLD